MVARHAVVRRVWTGLSAVIVKMTFITHDFSRGPWTSAVQGQKKLKYFFGGQVVEGECFNHGWTGMDAEGDKRGAGHGARGIGE